MRDPNPDEILSAICIVRTLNACGDNDEKKIRFVAWAISRWNMDVEEQQEIIKYLAFEKRIMRMREKKSRQIKAKVL